VLTQAKANASITAQAAAAFSHHGPVAETFIADRVPYAAAMTDGRTAIELDQQGPRCHSRRRPYGRTSKHACMLACRKSRKWRR
jgi:hypothetical protein